jgi:hypothetical protein
MASPPLRFGGPSLRLGLPALLALALASPLAAQETSAEEAWGPSAGRVLWLRADRGVSRSLSNLVGTWRDEQNQQVLVNPRGGTQPLWRAAAVHGEPALHFDGNDWLAGDGMPGGSCTQVLVCQLDEPVFAGDHVGLMHTTSGSDLEFAGFNRARCRRGSTTATSSVIVQAGRPVILVASYDAVTGALRIHQDGVPVAQAACGRLPLGGAGLSVGGDGLAGGLRGLVAEVMVYDRVLAGVELDLLHDYLRARYASGSAPSVRFSQAPQPGALLPRSEAGSATARFTGELSGGTWDTLVLETRRDGAPFAVASQPLSYAGGRAGFSIASELHTGLHDWSLSLRVADAGGSRLLEVVPNVVVGDVWLVNGQSNAVAADYHAEHSANAENSSHWVRSFGSSVAGPESLQDLHWALAEGEDIYEHGAVGAWALRLGYLLQRDQGVPVCLINGAFGGSALIQHLRNDQKPEDLSTIYGRLLQRTAAAGVQSSVRGMLWYQGEADAQFPLDWARQWELLQGAWSLDYPALERVYVLQLRDDCSAGGRELREIQRGLGAPGSRLAVMSTTAVPFHDGCHFRYAGYREIGDRLARVVGRDCYGSLDTQEIDAPNVIEASWDDPAHSRIRLKFQDPDDQLTFQPGAELDFLTEDDVAVLGGTVDGGSVVLQLAATSSTARIHYDGHPLDGPWLINSRGVGALAFANLPVR